MSLIITNCYGSAKVTRLQGRSVSIFKAPSWEAGYSHHPQITSLDGKLFASWSIGRMHEDCPGQKMVFATSSDLGETWSEPITLVAPVRGEYAETCITSGGLMVAGGSLVAYYTSYDFTLGGFVKFAESGFNDLDTPGFQSIKDVRTGIMTSSDAGRTWQNTGASIPGFVTNLSPVKLASGRLVITAHRLTAYTDDPSGVRDWKIAPLPGLPPDYYERSGGHRLIFADWRHLGICEGAIHEIPGRPLRLMLRTSKGRLAVSESHDNGASWGEPRLTEFTDCASRFQFGRLPDGRYFALNCPNPNLPESCLRRTPLVLSVSDDGDTFDRHYILGDEPDQPLRFPGGYKHGRYGYPYLHVLGDRVFVINSVGKENVECHVFALKDIN
jgi:hypothetical protein